ncbi:MAG: hypothetical protein P1U68_05935 [Verrucomicrobiales bacterium]|nr:hypothetical protein [Verrucomicrobiales bacterium]
MRTSLSLPCCITGVIGIGLIAPAAEIRDGERTTVYTIDSPCPAEIRVQKSIEDDRNEANIEVYLFNSDGLPERIFASGLTPPVSLKAGVHEYRGRSTLDGAPIFWACSLKQRNHELRWIAPESVDLRDGRTLEFYGKQKGLYREASDKTRLERALHAFGEHDRQLNREYTDLIAVTPAADLELIRSSQREWLTFRDSWIADGDNADHVGPGTISHTWMQAGRTLERRAYLNALNREVTSPPASGPGQYTDGSGKRLIWRPLSNSGNVAYFLDLRETAPPGPDHEALWGVASPSGPKGWISVDGLHRVFSSSGNPPPAEVRFQLTGNGRISVNPVSGEQRDEPGNPIESAFLRVDDLTPSTEPMRQILVALPDRALDDLTDPLTAVAREELVATGKTLIPGGGPERHRLNRIESESIHHLDVKVPFGGFTLARYPRPDGSGLVILLVRREQEQEIRLWEWKTGAEEMIPVERVDYFPEILLNDFYDEEEVKEAATEAQGFPLEKGIWNTLSFSALEPPALELIAPVPPSGGKEIEPIYRIEFPWNNVGFGLERYELRP